MQNCFHFHAAGSFDEQPIAFFQFLSQSTSNIGVILTDRNLLRPQAIGNRGATHCRRVLAQEIQSVNCRTRCGFADLPMLFGAVSAQFQHVTEHSDASSAARQFRKCFERRPHGRRIGVIGIVDNPDAVPLIDLHTHRKGPSVGESATNRAEILELLHRPYMDTFSRDEVLKSIRYYKGIFDWDFLVDEKQYGEVLKIFLSTKVLDAPIAYSKAVDMSFARKASQRS